MDIFISNKEKLGGGISDTEDFLDEDTEFSDDDSNLSEIGYEDGDEDGDGDGDGYGDGDEDGDEDESDEDIDDETIGEGEIVETENEGNQVMKLYLKKVYLMNQYKKQVQK